MFSYYGLAGAVTLALLNYIMLGFTFPTDGFYEHSFEIWLACTVVFPGLGNLGFTLLEYRLGTRPVFGAFVENITWVPFLCVFPSLLFTPHLNATMIQLHFLRRAPNTLIPGPPVTSFLLQYYLGRNQKGGRAI